MKLQFKTRTLVVFATLVAVVVGYYAARWRHYDAERQYLLQREKQGVSDATENMHPYLHFQRPTAEQWYADRGPQWMVDWPVLWLYGETVSDRSVRISFDSDSISIDDLKGLRVFEYLTTLSFYKAPLDQSHIDQIIKLDRIQNVYAGKGVLSRSTVDALTAQGIEVQHEGLSVDFDSEQNYLNLYGVYYPLDVENSRVIAVHELGQDGTVYRLRLQPRRGCYSPRSSVSFYSFPSMFRRQNFGQFEKAHIAISRDKSLAVDMDEGCFCGVWDGVELDNVQKVELEFLSREGPVVHLNCDFLEFGNPTPATIDTHAIFDTVVIVPQGDAPPHFEQAKIAAARILQPYEIVHAYFDDSRNGWAFKAGFDAE